MTAQTRGSLVAIVTLLVPAFVAVIDGWGVGVYC